jgi:hypothetical protein
MAIHRGSRRRKKKAANGEREAKRLYLYINTTFVIGSWASASPSHLQVSHCTNLWKSGQDLMNGSGNSAQAHLARVVEPAQAEVVHPPDLRRGSDGDVDADGIEIAEVIVKSNWGQCAVDESGAGWDRDNLGGDGGGVAGCLVVPEASEGEDTIWTAGVTAK